MLSLRYYCEGRGTEEIGTLLAQIKAKHNVSYEVLDLSSHGEYNEDKEKEIYERDFKPRARILKKRTGQPITSLRSRKAGHYFVSRPGTIAIVGDDGLEWYTLGNEEILKFLKAVLAKGEPLLKEDLG
jgi:hypothetical protein